MKINKNTMIVCAVAIALSGISMILLGVFASQFTGYSIVQNIILGIFSSFIVSFVISIIGYFHERNIIIEKTDNNIKSLYINMNVLSKIIGDTSRQIHTSSDLSVLPFGDISGLSALNIDFLNDMNIGLFSPFYANGRLAKVYDNLIEFQQVAYNIKNISMNLQAQTLEYQNQLLRMQPTPVDIQNLDVLKNAINIKTAKFHEYVTGQAIELEKIVKVFYERKDSKQSWENIKFNLLMQVEDIVKR